MASGFSISPWFSSTSSPSFAISRHSNGSSTYSSQALSILLSDYFFPVIIKYGAYFFRIPKEVSLALGKLCIPWNQSQWPQISEILARPLPYRMYLLWNFQESFGKSEEADGNLDVIARRRVMGSNQEKPANDGHPSLSLVQTASRPPQGSHPLELCPFAMFSLLTIVHVWLASAEYNVAKVWGSSSMRKLDKVVTSALITDSLVFFLAYNF